MRVFGYAWKINFSENIFSWPCVLMALTRKLVSVKIFNSNHFRTHAQRERERESLDHTFDFAGEPRAQITSSTSSIYEPIYELTNRSSTQSLRPTSLRLRRRPRAFAPRTHRPISLSLCDFDFLCDFDRPTNWFTFLCDFDFLLFLFDLWFFCFCCGGVSGGVLVVFLLCGGGFCVGGGGK